MGVYVAGDSIVGFGRQDRATVPGEEFHPTTDATARALLSDTEDYRLLRWDGFTVARRSPAEIAAILAADLAAEDDEFFNGRRIKAALTAIVLAVNSRLSTAGLPAITRAELLALYRGELGK